jgi:CDP-4-dehydro-6-deoxyglucose reductase
LADYRARIASIAHHDSGVRLITLDVDSEFHFNAGQYLNVVHPRGVRIPMSIASAPERLPHLELHFRALPGVPDAALMIELLDTAANDSREITIDGPMGAVFVNGPTDADLLLIAGGSGIAQCRAIVEHLCFVRQRRDVSLLWSVTHADQLYCGAELEGLAPWLRYTSRVDSNGENAAVAWLRDHVAKIDGRVIVSGSPGFVYAVNDALDAIGVSPASIESDVFSYAPRRPGGSSPPSTT